MRTGYCTTTLKGRKAVHILHTFMAGTGFIYISSGVMSEKYNNTSKNMSALTSSQRKQFFKLLDIGRNSKAVDS
jgi:hypothetical protein